MDFKAVRVYQRDNADQIRIGPRYYITDLDKEEEKVRKAYEERFGGDFDEMVKEYKYTIAIVDADTLAPVRTVSFFFAEEH